MPGATRIFDLWKMENTGQAAGSLQPGVFDMKLKGRTKNNYE